MDIFDVLTMIGGLCLFLFGMNIMGEALERQAGGKLRDILGKLTSNKWMGFLTGLGVTAVIQSSSATTVMVVGFVNSGLMTLRQAIGVIMGANVGTTVTAWILSLSGIEGTSLVMQLLKPSSFTPILALLGVIFYMFLKDKKRKDTGLILLGFATLMFGMETMSGAVKGLADVPEFRNILLLFQNPILGVLAGAVLTAIIQSSSASVGILQALSATGQVTLGAAIPIIMGQNIGTCITAMLASVGTTKNARRAAVVHLCFNIIGTSVWLAAFWAMKGMFAPAILNGAATEWSIAVSHSLFNVGCTILMLPLTSFLEHLAIKLVPDSKEPEEQSRLDDLLMITPAIALEQCRQVAGEMAQCAREAIHGGLDALDGCTEELSKRIRSCEDQSDRYEDMLGSYLVKLSAQQLTQSDNDQAAMLLRAIGDFERISDHGVNLLECAEEMDRKGLKLTDGARKELQVLENAVFEVMELSFRAFENGDMEAARKVEPLEQVVDSLKETLRARHILRMQQGQCSIESGFIWSDLLTSLERTSDHCSNLAGCVLELESHSLNTHALLRAEKAYGTDFERQYVSYAQKYRLP